MIKTFMRQVLLLICAAGVGAAVYHLLHAESSLPPTDFTAKWSPSEKSMVGACPWLTNAVGWTHSGLKVFTPANPMMASMHVEGVDWTNGPNIFIEDGDTNGVPDTIMIFDNNFRNITMDVKEGRFTRFDYSTGVTPASTTYIDSNCDGAYERTFGPDLVRRVNVSGQWYVLVRTNNQSMIRQGDEWRLVKEVDGMWKTE